MRFFYFLFFLALIGCNSIHSNKIETGWWQFSLVRDTTPNIPFSVDFHLVDGKYTATISNADEKIKIEKITIKEDSLFFDVNPFASRFSLHIKDGKHLEGKWTILDKDNYHIPVKAELNPNRFPLPNSLDDVSGTWQVMFSPDTENEYPAKGVFQSENGFVTGSFLTETGDYRFLEGVIRNDSLLLSCFDGAHAFLFTGVLKGDTISDGVFYSGKHWNEPWVAYKDSSYTLTHPDSLTAAVSEDGFSLSFKTLEGDSITLSTETLQGQVTMIQVLGTWCPNCMDESRYYKHLTEQFKGEDLEIVGVAYERPKAFDKQAKRVKDWVKKEAIPYPVYIGGTASKKRASEHFHFLMDIISFPTTIFVDKAGKIRKVHTGFYGPGTGSFYEDYKKETEAFLTELLAESW